MSEKLKDAGLLLEVRDLPVSQKTVIRLQRKAIGGLEFIDLRLCRLDKQGKIYYSRKGICMRRQFWRDAITKLFNGLLLEEDMTPKQEDTIAQAVSPSET